jgi:precorrin-6A/cobalt-precorrin-6A reductase
MAEKVLVFAGTTEGRNICEYLAKHGVDVTVSVATEYGRVVLPELEKLHIHTGRLDAEMMIKFINGYSFVIDATHPYADRVTHNIKEACEAAGAEYQRLLRPSSEYEGAVIVASAKAAAEYLRWTSGKVLITTGSKELAEFASLENFQNRCFARVLPTVESIEVCRELGLKGGHIICMQGPFSHQLNLAMIRETCAKYLVTKDSGAVGGFAEKLSAAKEAGVTVILIARPKEEAGFDYNSLIELLNHRFGFEPKKEGHFPAFIDIAGKKVVLIGGGKIAARRAAVLLKFGVMITVVSPELGDGMRELLNDGNILWQKKNYENGDISGAMLAVCASNSREANCEAAKEARERGIPVSVADQKSESTFYFPAIVEGGGVLGGFVSAGGDDHHAVREQADRIRRMLNEQQ